MPWCDGCQKFYSPNTLRSDGTCPEDHFVTEPASVETKGAPWHFWVLLIGVLLYLGWRLVQGIGWLFG